MTRTRSRRFCGLLQAFRRWAPWTVHLALAAVLNSAFDGPALADEIGRWRALDASLVEADRVPGPPSLDELVALLAPLMESDASFLLPQEKPAPEPAASQRVSGASRLKAPRPRPRTEAVEPSQIAMKLSPLPETEERIEESSTAVLEAAASAAPPIPPPPSLPGLPQEESGQPVSSASPAAAVSAAGDAIPLILGWNLVSLPKQPDSVDPASVLVSISGSYQVVHAYDACSSDPWRTYDSANPAESSLTAIDHRMGLWVRATAAATLAVSGTEPVETSIQLCQGWNLIGYPLSQARPVLAALSSIAGKFQRVYGWDPADPADPWEVFDVAVPAWANDLEQMLPGRGYWVYATVDTTLVMSNAGLPPEVEISSPANAAAVTAPTDIVGTVRSNLLESWTLAWRLKGETGSFTTFATGNTPVSNGVLGKLDPRLLLNGLYEIELTATDFQGQSVSISIDVVVEGELKIGNFTLSFTDLEVPLAGLPIQVIRTYDSRDKRVGDFGVGWTLSLSNVRLQEDGPVGEGWQGTRSPGAFPTYCVVPTRGRRVTVTLPDDTVLRFEPRVSPQCQPLVPPQVVTLTYAPLPGTLATLEMLDQSLPVLVVGSFPGPVELWDQETVELQDPGRYRLTLKDGRQLVIDQQQGGLTSIKDRNGNELTVGRNGITHSSGKGITFQRDGHGRITQITDPADKSLTYSYDAAGDLVTVIDREAATSRFTYSSNHFLLSTQNPLGRQPIRNEYDAAGRLIRTTDAFGKTIELTHDVAANREVVTDRLGHSRVLEYDARGNVVRETDAFGKVTARTFGSEDRLLLQTDPLGHTTSYAYDANGNQTEIRDPLGNVTRYTYDASGNVLTATDPRGKATTSTYDAAGNLLSTRDPLGNITTYTYDEKGNLLTETDAAGGVTTYVYDVEGNVVRETDALGTVTTATYDRNGNRLTQSLTRTTPSGPETLPWTYTYETEGRLRATTNPDGSTRETVYDAMGQVTATIDALGRRTERIYDELGRPVQMRYPDGTTEALTYDAEGRRLTLTDRGGHTTSFVYDAAGRIETTTFADGSSTENVYDAAGRLTSSVDARGHATTYTYDAAGRRTGVTDALGHETLFDFDAAGNQTAVTDARGKRTRYVYDDAGRPIRVEHPDGATTETEYDRLGRRTQETDEAGNATRFGYDALGQLVTVTDALGQVTRYAYNERGNRISQIDANGHETSFEHDALGRRTRIVLPDGTVERRAYDLVGNLKERTRFDGAVVRYAYDAADRLLSRSYPDGTSVSFTYTPAGRRSTAVDARGTTSYTYDQRDLLVSRTYPDGRELRYAWDAAGNRTALTAVVGGTTFTTTYSYDDLDRLETVTDPAGRVYEHAYDPNGNRASLSYPNGVETTYRYDDRNRLLELSSVRPADSSVVQSYVYTLGPAGNRTAVREHDGTLRDYGYDALYRLTTETVSDALGMVYRNVFGYDPAGNRIRQDRTRRATGGGTTTAVITYGYDSRDRLLTGDSAAYGWDADGNLTSRSGPAGATYQWDFEDRLVQATLADGTVVRHEYDVDGVRVRTEVTPAGGPATVVEYLVDMSGPLSQVVAEGPNTTTVATLYVRGDDLLAVIRGAQARWYHADGLGSIRALTDETGAVTDRWSFEAFGSLLSHQGTDPQAYLFAGEPLDPNLGFYQLRARWMDPALGRFASTDPHPGSEFDPASLHKYLYARNAPTVFIDPTGRDFSLASFSIAAAVRGALIGVAITAPFRLLAAAQKLRAGADLGAVSQELALGLAQDFAIGLVLGGVLQYIPRLFALRFAGEAVKRASTSFWNLNPFARGRAIEQAILGGPARFPNAPVVEDVVEGVATSIKSIDLTAVTYESTSALRSLVSRYARDLATFTFNIGPFSANQVSQRVLVIAIEEGAATAAQATVLQQFMRTAQYLWPEIKVLIVAIP